MTTTMQLIAALTATAVIGGAAAVGTSDPNPVDASAESAVTAEAHLGAEVATDARSEPIGTDATAQTDTAVRADLAGHVASNIEDTPAAETAADAVAHASAVTEATLDAGNNGDAGPTDPERSVDAAAVASSKGEATAEIEDDAANVNAEIVLGADLDVTAEGADGAVADAEGSAASSAEFGLDG